MTPAAQPAAVRRPPDRHDHNQEDPVTTPAPYDSTADTLRHSLRVGELMGQIVSELVARSTQHDRSKTEPPELEIFNEYTPKLKHSTYGSDEYKGFLAAMGDGLAHHYAHNRHHPEHFENGVNGMTLVDLIEMLADWRAATERHDDGNLGKSLRIQRDRFGLSEQLFDILWNTAAAFRWLPGEPCGATTNHWMGEEWICNVPIGRDGKHQGTHEDGRYSVGAEWPNKDASPTDPEAMREAASRLLTAADEAEAGR